MRHSNQSIRGNRRREAAARRRRPTVALIVLALLVLSAACGTTAVGSPTPTPVATPAPTPDPHLHAPVTADQVYLAIASAHLSLYSNNALLDQGSIVKRINADLEGWPIRITAYDSVADLLKARSWKPGQEPGRGEAPYTFAALNVSVEYGPITGAMPVAPDAAHQATAAKIVGILDPLLWPIEQHSVVAIPARTIPPPPTATPAPTKPKTPSPKPTKKP
jgi:hypothetical protein